MTIGSIAGRAVCKQCSGTTSVFYLLEISGGFQAMLCELCECEEAHNFHRFIPRTLHTNKWFKKRYAREEMRREGKDC